MAFYQQSGVLFFGSRLRRLSEAFLADINSIYRHHGIKFDAAWFPIFFMLSDRGAMSIRDISDELETSHSAASQMITKLEEKGLIKSTSDKSDGRKKLVAFTPKGQKLLQQVLPIWKAVQLAMDEMLQQDPQTRELMGAISNTENALKQLSIFERIEKHIQ